MKLEYGFSFLDLKLAILIFILTSSLYLIFMDGNTTGNGYFYFLCAQSIIRDHDLSIEPELPYGNPIYDERAPQRRDGTKHLYNHVGWPIILLPLTALGTFLARFSSYKTLAMFIASTTNSFITAFTCVILYLFSRRLKYSPRTSTLLSLFYGFTTMAFPYATNSFCEPANTLMILLSLYWLYSFCQNRFYPLLALSGLALGYACFIRIWDLILVPGVLFYLTLYLKKERIFKIFPSFIIFLLPIVFMLLINETYFYIIYWDSYFFGEGSKRYGDFALFQPFSTLPTGLPGLLFSTGKGLFFYNPVILLSLFTLRSFYLRHRLEALLFVYIFIAFLFSIGSLAACWPADISWGPRYLLPTIPFFFLLLAGSERKKSFWPMLLLIAGIAGLMVQLPALLVDTDLYTIHTREKGISFEEIYFIPRHSPIIGTWNMLLEQMASLSKDKPTGLSPWLFRLFDQEISTQQGGTITITSQLTHLVWLVIMGLIFMALVTAYTILYLLRESRIRNTPSNI